MANQLLPQRRSLNLSVFSRDKIPDLLDLGENEIFYTEAAS